MYGPFSPPTPDAADHRATLLQALKDTASTAVSGYVAGLATGAVLAALLATPAPWIISAVLPIAVTLRAVAIVITAPLIACLHRLRLVPRSVLDFFNSYAAGRWQILCHARVPAALPAFFASARIPVPAAVLAATVAE